MNQKIKQNQIVFACISPHPPIILPSVGSLSDRIRVKNTIRALEKLSKEIKKKKFEKIIISSPHPDWGIEVPLFFLAPEFKGEIKIYLTNLQEPSFYFQEGKLFYKKEIAPFSSPVLLIASGDMSHCLKEDGPYGFHPDGPQFDQSFIKALKGKDIKSILKLEKLYPQASECGLRSFCFLLGILEESGLNWQPKVLSYEGPFGVGYLVVNFKLK